MLFHNTLQIDADFRLTFCIAMVLLLDVFIFVLLLILSELVTGRRCCMTYKHYCPGIRHIVFDIHCSWVSTRWQWSVNLYTNRKETTKYVRRNNTKTQNTLNRKRNVQNKKEANNKKNTKRVIRR